MFIPTVPKNIMCRSCGPSLLQAHAQCATIRATGDDGLCAAIVAEAQKPHRDMLLVLWRALLQDHVMIETQPRALLLTYSSTLYGDASAAIVHAIRPHLAAAAPAVLDALSKHMPKPEALLAAKAVFATLPAAAKRRQSSDGTQLPPASWDDFGAVLASLAEDKPVPRQAAEAPDASAAARSAVAAWAQKTAAAQAQATAAAAYKEFMRTRGWHVYASTVDLALMVTAKQCAAAAEAAQAARSRRGHLLGCLPRLQACLRGLHRLIAPAYASSGLCNAAVCSDVLSAAAAIAVQVLSPLQRRALRARDAGLAAAVLPALAAAAEVLRDATGVLTTEQLGERPELASLVIDAALAMTAVAVPFGMMQGRFVPLPPPPAPPAAPEAAGGAAPPSAQPALVSALLSAQALVKKVPLVGLAFVAQPLLRLGVRLACSAPPSGGAAAAAQRYMEGLMAAAAERLADPELPPQVRAGGSACICCLQRISLPFRCCVCWMTCMLRRLPRLWRCAASIPSRLRQTLHCHSFLIPVDTIARKSWPNVR